MERTGSFIETVLERIRLQVIDPGAGTGMFNDDVIVRQLMGDAHAETFSLLKLSDDSLPIVKTTITIEEGTSRYVIPPCLEHVMRLVRVSDNNRVIHDWVPGELFGAVGPGWRIEGNEIVFEPDPVGPTHIEGVDEQWQLWGVPSGDVCLHKGTGEVVDENTIELDPSPTLGLLDRRPNGYCGLVLRTIGLTRSWQERVIATFDHTTGRVGVHTPFLQSASDLPDDGQPVEYEIAPLGNRAMWNTVAWKCVLQIGASRDWSMKKMQLSDMHYQKAVKALTDRSQHMWRLVKHFSRRNVDNNPLYDLSLWSFDGIQ